MRKTTTLLLLLTLCIATAAFADSGQLGSGNRADGPMVGSGVGDGPTYGSGVGDASPLRAPAIFLALRVFLGI